jgi:hypothetical protein
MNLNKKCGGGRPYRITNRNSMMTRQSQRLRDSKPKYQLSMIILKRNVTSVLED